MEESLLRMEGEAGQDRALRGEARRGATRIVEGRLGLATRRDKVDYRVVWARVGMYVGYVPYLSSGGGR